MEVGRAVNADCVSDVGRHEDVSGYAAKMSAFASARCQWLRAGFSPGLRPPDVFAPAMPGVIVRSSLTLVA